MNAFVAPSFLWALPLALAPLIVHLLYRRRIRRQVFSSLMFLPTAAVHASRRRRLRRLLLLLVRTLLMLVIVLLFAQPYDRRDPFAALRSSQARVYCWIDPTMSMTFRTAEGSLAGRAWQALLRLDSLLERPSRALLFDPAREEFVPVDELGTHGISPRYGESGCQSLWEAVERERGRRGGIPYLVLFSDFQEATAKILDTLFSRGGPDLPVIYVSCAPREPWNYSLIHAAVEAGPLPRMTCRVAARGRALREAELMVMRGGMVSGRGSVSCEPGDTAEITLQVTGGDFPPGGTVRLTSSDPLAFDDSLTWVMPRGTGENVVIVASGPEAFPLTAAIRTMGAWGHPLIRGPYEVSLEEIEAARVVVVANIGDPSRALDALISGRTGGGKVIVVSPAMGKEGGALMDRIVERLDQTRSLSRREHDPSLFVVLPDTVSAVWKGFPRLVERQVAVTVSFAGLPGTPLCRLSDGEPLITWLPDNQGNIWLLSGAALTIDKTANLCETGFFLPFLDRIIRFGQTRTGQGGDGWEAGRPRLNPYASDRQGAWIYDNNGREIARWERQPEVMFDSPGLYRIQSGDQSGEWVSVGFDPQEGAFDYRLPRKEHRDEGATIMDLTAFTRFCAGFGTAASADFLWLGLLLLLFAELLLFSRSGAAPSRPEPK